VNSDKSLAHIFNHELKLRVASALVLGILILLITWIGGKTFALLWAAIAIAVYFEFCRICSSAAPKAPILAGYGAVFVVSAAWISGNDVIAHWMAMIFVLVFVLWEVLLRKSVWVALGLVYAIVPFFAMSTLRGETDVGLFLILVLFACVWGADVFAFFFGKAIGGPKLAPRLSPKKTWAGFIGSLIGAVSMSVAVSVLFGYPVTILFLVLIVFLAVISQIGDLLESMLKRRFDVKDSGSLIPGHGGVLDRVDGLIVAGASLWIILLVMQMSGNSIFSLHAVFANAFLMP